MSFRGRCFFTLSSFLLSGICLPLSGATIGYYQFEDTPGVFQDSSAANRDLTLSGAAEVQVASTFGTVSNPPAGSVANAEAMSFATNRGFTSADIDYADLTIEAFVNVASVASDAVARVIAGQYGSGSNRAFNFGIAGNGSGAFPADRTVFLQLGNAAGTIINIDSTFRLTLNTNYYLAASIDAGSLNGGANGSVTFYLKDLTNGGVLQSATITATGFDVFANSANVITIGASGDGTASQFSGVLDEVRLSDVALSSDQLLIAAIPEPSTFSLIVGGLVLVGVVCRRQRVAC